MAELSSHEIYGDSLRSPLHTQGGYSYFNTLGVPFLGAERFSHRESLRKISNLMVIGLTGSAFEAHVIFIDMDHIS